VVDILAAKQGAAVLGLHLDILHNHKSYTIHMHNRRSKKKACNARALEEAHVC
jgi:hypothetical protein